MSSGLGKVDDIDLEEKNKNQTFFFSIDNDSHNR